MYHIEAFMHPQAVLIDGSGQEDPLFLRALREKLVQVQKPLIEMPNDVAERFMWITRLDYGSLRGEFAQVVMKRWIDADSPQ